MANVVSDLVYDVAQRIGIDPAMMDEPGLNFGSILRAMDRVYHQINRELKCIQIQYSLDEDSREEDEDYWVLPSDFVAVYVWEGTDADKYSHRIPSTFDYEEEYDWTIEGVGDEWRIIIPSAADDFDMNMHYYSEGLTIVSEADDDLAATETNTPEWPTSFHALLMYATCLEVSADYPHREQDIINVARMKEQLAGLKRSFQTTDPTVAQGYELLSRS